MLYPTKKLWDLCKIQNWFAFKSSDYIEKSNTLNFRMSNIRIWWWLDLNHNNKYLPDEYIIKYSNFLLQDWDIVIAMTDMATDPKILAIPTIIIKDNRNLLLNQRVWRFIDINFQTLDISYLRYILLSPEIRKKLVSMWWWWVQINISTKQILSIPIPLPPLPTQKLIVQKLDSSFKKIDKSIELTKKNLKNIEELNKSVLEKVFSDWDYEIKTIDKISENVQYWYTWKTTEKWQVKYLRITDIQENKIIWEDVPYVKIEENEISKYSLNEWDIVFARTWATVWKSCLIDRNWIWNIFASYLIRIVWKKEIINPSFMQYFFYSKNYWEQIWFDVVWAAQPNFNWTKLKQIKIPLPPLQKQKEIVIQLDKVFEKNKALKQSYEKKLKDLEEMKQSLLKEAFEGRLVKE